MFVNKFVKIIGGDTKDISTPNKTYLFSPTYSFSPPKRWNSWAEEPKGNGVEHFYELFELVDGDFSVWCDERKDFVPISEGVYAKVGNKYVWFEPCYMMLDDSFREVHGEFELNFIYSKLRLKVKA